MKTCVLNQKKKRLKRKIKYDSDSDNDSDDVLLDCSSKLKKIDDPNKWQVWTKQIKKEVLDLISNDVA